LDAETGGQKSTRETVIVGRDRGTWKIGGKIPAETASFRSTTVSAVREDWMVETIWTKLAAPHAGIEPSLRKSSRERNFLLQRPGGEMGSFASIAGTETALTSQFGRHAFENAALLRVSHTLYNYRVWVVGVIGIEPVTPF
jgi:hypothetical protein